MRMEYFRTMLFVAVLCVVQTTRAAVDYEFMNPEQVEYHWVRGNLQKSLDALVELRSRAVIVVQERISGIDIGIELKSGSMPRIFQGDNDEDAAPITPASEASIKCLGNALQNLQPYLERLKYLYSHGKALERTLDYFVILCNETQKDVDTYTCAGKEIEKVGYTLGTFEKDVASLVKQATAASKISMRRISNCFFEKGSIFRNMAHDEEDEVNDDEEDEFAPIPFHHRPNAKELLGRLKEE